MAEAKANLIIQLKDEASKGLSAIGGAVNKLKSHWIGITATVAAFGGALYSTLKAYGEQESATVKLDTALKNAGVSTAGATQRLTALATQLQNTTTFGDEAIIGMQGLLATFKLNESSIAALTPKLLDVSTAMGIDLQTAALAVGKALNTGTVAQLTRLGIAVDDAAFKLNPMNALMNAFANSNGQAAAAANTSLGKIEQLKNAFSDLMEMIGGLIAGPAVAIIDWLSKLVVAMQQLPLVIAFVSDTFNYFVELMFNGWTFITETIQIFWTFFQEFSTAFMELLTLNFTSAFNSMGNSFNDLINGMSSNWDRLKKKNAEAFANSDATNKALAVSHKTLNDTTQLQQKQRWDWQENQQAAHDKKTAEQEAKTLSEARKRNEDHFLNMQKLRQQEQKEVQDKLEKETQLKKQHMQEFISLTQSSLSTLASLQESHDRKTFIIGKAAAMANAIVSVAQGVSKALSLPFPANIAAAAVVGAAGAVQIHKIGATSMAEGGIVLPRAGGTLARIGEAGQSEAVIPLDDERADGIIGGTTVNINAGVVVADDESIRKLAEMIDAKLFDLSRNNLSVTV